VKLEGAFVIGVGSAVAHFYASTGLEALGVDDVVSAVPVHLAAGLWGVIAAGFFTSPSLYNEVITLSTEFRSSSKKNKKQAKPSQNVLCVLQYTISSLYIIFGFLIHSKYMPCEKVYGEGSAKCGGVLYGSGGEVLGANILLALVVLNWVLLTAGTLFAYFKHHQVSSLTAIT
jgi:ammonia channel protein AmtB